MADNFDIAAFTLAGVCPGNEILYDDKGMPSIMVKIPKMTYAQLGLGSSTATHPAFIVNGKEVDAIYISKYQNIVQNGRAYSHPAQDPKASVTFDTARGYCEAKGGGWHIMTRAEWALIALWCKNTTDSCHTVTTITGKTPGRLITRLFRPLTKATEGSRMWQQEPVR